MPLRSITRYEPEMKRLKVSEVARSPRGFLTNLKKNKGKVSTKWESKRNGFIARTLPSYKKRPTVRRRLALIAWAYKPD